MSRSSRRWLLASLTVGLIAALLGGTGPIGAAAQLPAAAPTAPVEPPRRDVPIASSVVSVAMTVDDVDRSVRFYSRVLGFEKIGETEVSGPEYELLQGVPGLRARVVRMRLGDERIDLWEYLTPRGRPVPLDSRSQDRWFQHIAIAVSDMDRAHARLRRHRVTPVSRGPQRLPDWNPSAGGVRAFYFKDPDGHVLELISFPLGKGDVRWRMPGSGLFLGIDHTAIVVRDTEESLRFYRDTLGLAVAGASENYGPEQERLNRVQGARLRITTLRAARGPGVELLEYLAPRDGRPYPVDARANDLLHWHVRLDTASAPAAEDRLRETRAWFASPGFVDTPDVQLGFRRGLLVRDPDGHALQITSD